MPSKAHKNLAGRMKDIEQLLEAHKAMTQFKRARSAAERAGGELEKISEVIGKLVQEPGRGRRKEVAALNRSAMVLLSAHLQGYIEDVYDEATHLLLDGKIRNVNMLIRQAKRTFSNPHANRINSLYASIGIPDIMDGLSWQGAANKAIKRRLSEYIKIRNDIAHGSQESITKQKVTSFKQFVEVFARNFDEKVSREIRSIIRRSPW